MSSRRSQRQTEICHLSSECGCPGIQKIPVKPLLFKSRISHAISGIERQLGHFRKSTIDSPAQQNILRIDTKEFWVTMAPVIAFISPRGIKDLLRFGIRSVRVRGCGVADPEGRAARISTHEDSDPLVVMRRPENITGTATVVAGGYGSCRGLVFAPACFRGLVFARACATVVRELGGRRQHHVEDESRHPRNTSSSKHVLMSLPLMYLLSHPNQPWQYTGSGLGWRIFGKLRQYGKRWPTPTCTWNPVWCTSERGVWP